MNIGLPRSQSGFSLIELSVASVVLSMGLGGLSLMMMLAVHGTTDARYRTMAATEASSLAESILMNPASVEHFINPAPLMYEDCANNDLCSEGELASGWMNSWRARVRSDLPAGQGIVCKDSSVDDGTSLDPACDGTGDAVIKVFWGAGPEDSSQEGGRVTYRLPGS